MKINKEDIINDLFLINHYCESIEKNIRSGELMAASVTCASFKSASLRIVRQVDALLKEAQKKHEQQLLISKSDEE